MQQSYVEDWTMMDVSLKINSYEREITKPATNKVDITFNNMRENDIDRIGRTGHARQDDSTIGQRYKIGKLYERVTVTA